MKLGVSLPVFTADPSRPLGVAARAPRARRRRRVLARPPVPAGLLSAVGARPARARAVRPARGRGGAPPALARRHAGHAGHPPARRAPREAGGGARRDVRRPRDPRGRHAATAPRCPSTRRYGFPFPPRGGPGAPCSRRRSQAMRCAVRGPSLAGRRPRAPRSSGPLAAGRARPSSGWGDVSDEVLAVAARVRRRVERVGPRRRRVRGASVERLRELADGRDVAPTWGGSPWWGRIGADLRAAARRSRPSEGSRARASGRERPLSCARSPTGSRTAGAAWCIVLPVGPTDRLERDRRGRFVREQRSTQAGEEAGPRDGARRAGTPSTPAGAGAARRPRDRPSARAARGRAAGTVMAFWSFGSELSDDAADRGAARRAGCGWRCPGSSTATSSRATWRPGEPDHHDLVRCARARRRRRARSRRRST